MTEEGANTKWCPFARVLAESRRVGSRGEKAKDSDPLFQLGGGYNRQATVSEEVVRIPSASRCIASACIAWRIASRTIQTPDKITIGGFCGLAGKL